MMVLMVKIVMVVVTEGQYLCQRYSRNLAKAMEQYKENYGKGRCVYEKLQHEREKSDVCQDHRACNP